MKQFKIYVLLLVAAVSFAACTDEESDALLREGRGTIENANTAGNGATGAYIINQGNAYSKLPGTMSFLDYAGDTLRQNVFAAANGQGLGDGPQDGVFCKEKLYVALSGSNLVWAIDPATNKAIKAIETTAPQGLAASGDYVYVSNNDGFVSKIDAAKDSVVGKIAVGPNPVDMEVRNGYLYVSISDGYNYNNGYANGFRIAKIQLSNFTKVGDVKVGMNPYKMTQDKAGNIFVVCNGDYAAVPSTVYKIDSQDVASEFCKATTIAASDSLLYTINAVTNWSTYTTTTDYAVYNSIKGSRAVGFDTFLNTNAPVAPIAMSVQPRTGELYVTSRSATSDYTTAGFLYVYDKTGKFQKRYNTGVEPYAVVFK